MAGVQLLVHNLGQVVFHRLGGTLLREAPLRDDGEHVVNGGFEADGAPTVTHLGVPDAWTAVGGGPVIRLCEDDADDGWTPRPAGKTGRFAVALGTVESPWGPPTGGQEGVLASYDTFLLQTAALTQVLERLTVGATYRVRWRAAAGAVDGVSGVGVGFSLEYPAAWRVPTATVTLDGRPLWTSGGLSTSAYTSYEATFTATAPTAVLCLANATAPYDGTERYGILASLVAFDDVGVVSVP